MLHRKVIAQRAQCRAGDADPDGGIGTRAARVALDQVGCPIGERNNNNIHITSSEIRNERTTADNLVR